MTEVQVVPVLAEPIVVDRSPELLRGARSTLGGGGGMPVNFYIDEEDIREGERGDGGSCALARCLLRFPFIEAVRMEGEQPQVKYRGAGWQNVRVAADLAEWIGRFDRHEPVAPFAGVMGIPLDVVIPR